MKNLPGNPSLALLVVGALHSRGWAPPGPHPCLTTHQQRKFRMLWVMLTHSLRIESEQRTQAPRQEAL